jgi:hypothetical protein
VQANRQTIALIPERVNRRKKPHTLLEDGTAQGFDVLHNQFIYKDKMILGSLWLH